MLNTWIWKSRKFFRPRVILGSQPHTTTPMGKPTRLAFKAPVLTTKEQHAAKFFSFRVRRPRQKQVTSPKPHTNVYPFSPPTSHGVHHHDDVGRDNNNGTGWIHTLRDSAEEEEEGGGGEDSETSTTFQKGKTLCVAITHLTTFNSERAKPRNRSKTLFPRQGHTHPYTHTDTHNSENKQHQQQQEQQEQQQQRERQISSAVATSCLAINTTPSFTTEDHLMAEETLCTRPATAAVAGVMPGAALLHLRVAPMRPHRRITASSPVCPCTVV